MWVYEKKLQYPIKIKNPNPQMAKIIISQYGGPDGELGASLRYLSQRFSMPNEITKATLNDIGTYYPKFSYLCQKKIDRLPAPFKYMSILYLSCMIICSKTSFAILSSNTLKLTRFVTVLLISLITSSVFSIANSFSF